MGLGPAALKPTRLLPYGEQRLLEVALALALRPRVLLLDEPAAGLSTAQGAALFERVETLAGDTTLLFIEHDMHLVFKYAQRVSVFAAGRMIAQDRPEQVRRDPAVLQAYLGRCATGEPRRERTPHPAPGAAASRARPRAADAWHLPRGAGPPQQRGGAGGRSVC